jgi:predicted acetyltransferase
VRTTTLEDGLWARILDVPAALSARRYGVELDLVLEVDDAFLGRGGRFRLRGGPDGACCEPAGSSTAQVRLDVATLAMLLFGTHRATELARAGLLAGAPAVLARADLAFAAERAVVHGSDF